MSTLFINKPWESATAESIGLDISDMTMAEFKRLHSKFGAEFGKIVGPARVEMISHFVQKYAEMKQKWAWLTKNGTEVDREGEKYGDLAPRAMEIARYLTIMQAIGARARRPIPSREIAAAYATKDTAAKN